MGFVNLLLPFSKKLQQLFKMMDFLIIKVYNTLMQRLVLNDIVLFPYYGKYFKGGKNVLVSGATRI